MASTNNLKISENTDSEAATASGANSQDSPPTQKRRRLLKTVPEISPVFEKLIDHSSEYSKKATKEMAKKNLDLSRLKRYLEVGRMVVNNLQFTISGLETRINEEQLSLNSPGFDQLLNDITGMAPIGTSHQKSPKSLNKSI